MFCKKIKFLLLSIIISYTFITNSAGCGLCIGDQAPFFKAESTTGKINFPEDFPNKWVILFSHPADFTPVCTTEFKKLAEINEKLKKLNCQLIGISVDSTYTHKLWLQSLGLGNTNPTRKVDFPVIGDTDMKVSKKYGMIHPNESKNQTVRSIYFIDPNHKIRAVFHYPLKNGRNFYEVVRLLAAMQLTDRDNVATPAGWKPGDKPISKENAQQDIMPD